MSHNTAGPSDDARTRAMAHLQNIGVRALASNLRRAAELDGALSQLSHGELTAEQRKAAVDTAHQLVGSAGTFGYDRVSDSARRLEHFFMGDADGDEVSLRTAVEELRQIERGLASGPDEDVTSD